MDYQLLKAEIDTDPLVVGYSGMTDQQVADSLNVRDGTYTYDLPSMTGKQVKDLMDATEYGALTDPNKQIILALTARDDLDPHGIDASIFLDAMPAGTNPLTSAALNAARTINASRAEELNIVGVGTDVSAANVFTARALA